MRHPLLALLPRLLLVALLGALMSATARADTGPLAVADGDAFVMDFSATTVCFVTPAALRERAPCKGVDPTQAESLSSAKLRVLALAKVTLSGSGAKVVVTVFRASSDGGVPDSNHVEKWSRDFESHMQASIGNAGVVRKGTARLDQSGTLPVLRLTTGVDGLAAGDARTAMLQYQAAAAFFARGAGYAIVVAGRDRDAAAIESLLDDLAKTVKLSAPNREPAHERITWAGIAGRVIGVLFWVGVAAVGLWFDRRRRLAAAAAAAHDSQSTPRKKKKKKKKREPVDDLDVR